MYFFSTIWFCHSCNTKTTTNLLTFLPCTTTNHINHHRCSKTFRWCRCFGMRRHRRCCAAMHISSRHPCAGLGHEVPSTACTNRPVVKMVRVDSPRENSTTQHCAGAHGQPHTSKSLCSAVCARLGPANGSALMNLRTFLYRHYFACSVYHSTVQHTIHTCNTHVYASK